MLMTFIKNEVVTRAHLDSFHSQQMQIIEDPIKQATEPLQEQLVVMQTRLSKLEASFQIGYGSSARRAASERPAGRIQLSERSCSKEFPRTFLLRNAFMTVKLS